MQRIIVFLSILWACLLSTNATAIVIDDFESGLPSGNDADGVVIGFSTFFGAGSSIGISTTNAHPPLPGEGVGNNVLDVSSDVIGFAGFIHSFENPAVDSWVPQDWTVFDALSLNLFGYNSGTALFIDILDNRNPGSTTDDAERFSYSFVDDFSGWRQITAPFSDFARKEIGNGAPNDGFGLTDVHGWAFGMLSTQGPISYYIDDFELQLTTVPIPGAVWLFGSGLLGLVGMARRKKAA